MGMFFLSIVSNSVLQRSLFCHVECLWAGYLAHILESNINLLTRGDGESISTHPLRLTYVLMDCWLTSAPTTFTSSCLQLALHFIRNFVIKWNRCHFVPNGYWG
jgi:hypothetical protein